MSNAAVGNLEKTLWDAADKLRKNEIAKLDYVLTPGRYVGLEETEDDFDFTEQFNSLKVELEKQMQEKALLNRRIMDNLAKISINQ